MTRGRGRHFWSAVGAGLALLILAVGWFAAISPQLAAATTARDDADALQVRNQALRTSVATLEKQDPDLLRASLQDTVAALPYDTALPALTRQLTQQAAQNHVRLDSIVVGTPSVAGGVAADPSASTAGTPLAIPITLSSTGRGADQRALLRAIQATGPRRALVNTIQLSPKGGDDGTVAGRSSMTATLTVFAAPLSDAAETQLQGLLDGGGSTS